MDDLSDEMLDRIIRMSPVRTYTGVGFADRMFDDLRMAAKELQRYRAAQRADAERVRSVVRAACLAVERTAVTAVHIEKLDRIIDRAVEQLARAAPVLSAEERASLIYWRQRKLPWGNPHDELERNDNAVIAIIDRLLGATC